ncbi:MAG: transglycosylase domain-containing protein [bacterium]|nr:transglycosylase domain-containing protein [bacterium]
MSSKIANRTPLVKKGGRRAFVLFMLTLALLMGASAGLVVGYIDYSLDQMETIQYLENYHPWMPSRLFSGDGERRMIANYFDENQNREMVPITDMPQNLINAVVALEDFRFYDHFGISLPDIIRAAFVNIQASMERGRLVIIQGGSTVTMQLAEDLIKNKHVPYDLEDMDVKSIRQKLWEYILALKIEKRYSKSEIMEIYLNQVSLYGNTYGVARAAKYFFGKEMKDLTLKECALFAGMLKAPPQYSPIRHPDRAQQRTTVVLNRMLELGYITPEQCQEAIEEPFVIREEKMSTNQIALYPYFSDAVSKDFNYEKILNKDGTPIKLKGLGVDIDSTIDIRLQEIAEQALRSGIQEQERYFRKNGGYGWGSSGYQVMNRYFTDGYKSPSALEAGKEYDAKILSDFNPDTQSVTITIPNIPGGEKKFDLGIDPEQTWLDEFDLLRSGYIIRVKAVEAEGGLRFELGTNKYVQGAIIAVQPSTGKVLAMSGGYNFFDPQNNGQFNRVVQAQKAQPGSAFKPLLYAAALAEPNHRWTPATTLRDQKIEFWSGWTPKNFSNSYYGRPTMRFCLAKSLNAASVWLLDNYKGSRIGGINGLRQFCRTMYDLNIKKADLTLALGSMGMTPYELAQAYAVLANQGNFMQLHTVETVTQREYRNSQDSNRQPKVLYRYHQPFEKRQRLSPQVAYLSTYLMRQVVEDPHGTAKDAMALPFYSVGKTGTTDNNTYAWYAGYSKDILCIVYLAPDDPQLSLGNRRTGSSVALPVWMDFMKKTHELYPDLFGEIQAPQGIVFRDICESSGLVATKSCPRSIKKYGDNYPNVLSMPFIEGSQPRASCNIHGRPPAEPYNYEPKKVPLDSDWISQTNPNTP